MPTLYMFLVIMAGSGNVPYQIELKSFNNYGDCQAANANVNRRATALVTDCMPVQVSADKPFALRK